MADLRRRAPDVVVHGGDLALMGPRPAEVVDRVRELGWPGVVGNTDELLWRPDEHQRQLVRAPALKELLALLFDAYAPDTRERLGDDRLAWLEALPIEHRRAELTVVHAQPGDLWRAPMPDASDGWLPASYASLGASLVGDGHIHRPFVRTLDKGMTVANAGSVGLSWAMVIPAPPTSSLTMVSSRLCASSMTSRPRCEHCTRLDIRMPTVWQRCVATDDS